MSRSRTFLVAALLAGCADLSPIVPGVCGNGVVEPDQGEDCDGKAKAEGSTCAPKGAPHECRYLCESQSDCPAGSACGLDGLCRASSLTWQSKAQVMPRTDETPLEITIGNADDDRRGDVFVQTPTSVVIHYDGAFSPAELPMTRDPIVPSIGPVADLSGDGLSDALIPRDFGYFVSLGSEMRAERATAYGALTLPPDVNDVQALSAEVLPDPGNELLVLAVLGAPDDRQSLVVHVSLDGPLTFIGKLPDAPSKLAGPTRSGRLNEAPEIPCDELVLSYKDKASLDLFVPCALTGTQVSLSVPEATTSPIRLPKGATVAGAAVIEDLDGDQHLDILVPARQGNTYEIDVAYGRGDGTFHSAPGTGGIDGAAGVAVILNHDIEGLDANRNRLPLAVYDFDGDHGPDWVDEGGVYLSRGDSVPVLAGANLGAVWTTAISGSFDGDGLPDVAAGSSAASGISLFLNAGKGSLTHSRVPTRGNVKLLGTGDFDGDRVGDLSMVTTRAAASRLATAEESSDSLSVAFGSAFGPPSAPKDIGEFHEIKQLASARVNVGSFPVVDGADELGAFARDADGTLAFAVVFGQGNRDLRAPYYLTYTDLMTNTVVAYFPFRMAIGNLDDDGYPDVISLSQNLDDPRDNRIATNPMGPGASIRLGKSAYSDKISVPFDWDWVLFTTVDLDGEPGDEVVILGPEWDDKAKKRTGRHFAAVGKASAGADKLVTYHVKGTSELDSAFSRTEIARTSPTTRNGRLLAADVDGDGAKDLVALGESDGRGEVVVFFNDLTGEIGSPARIAGAEDLDVRDFAVLQGPGDRTPQLALLTSDAVHVASARGRNLVAAASPGLSMPESAGAPLMLVATGDVDGDGVPDLAVTNPFGFEVHLGTSTNRSDAQ